MSFGLESLLTISSEQQQRPVEEQCEQTVVVSVVSFGIGQ